MKRIKMIVKIYLAVLIALTSCEKDSGGEPGDSSALNLTIQADATRQKIHGFGASDAWSCQFVGKNWPENKKEQMADWLFSRELDGEGHPKGIGLNTWRFNIGGGSAEQGAASEIKDEWRRAESFMTSKGVYDWSKHQGQRWFLKAAKERGVNQFVGFVNSPPVSLTKNGKAYSSDKNHYNLAEENYSLFADYLADVALKVKEQDGVSFKYISPFNEPQWDWTNKGQEGTPAQNTEIAAATKVINMAFEQKNVNAMLEIPESAQLNFMYENGGKSGRGFQVYSFFDPSSPEYLGKLSHVAPKVAAHSYYTTWPVDEMASIRRKVNETIKSNPEQVEFWMSEYCVLENNPDIEGNGRDLGMKTALYTSRVIFTDLAIANASSWQWWLAISPYDYKDGLVYIDYNKNDGTIYDSKTMWALGNYSRFIKESMQRVLITRSDSKTDEQSLNSIMSCAFTSEDKSELTVVITNYLHADVPVKVNLKGAMLSGKLKVYLTDGKSGNNLAFKKEIDLNEELTIPARSVVTISNVD
ncbi:glycoside hydrolase [Carboxylicivirga sp. RSCT41]|uniref:glycoside hydrolase n=1 Tax=Carboxylicivirga agarovorans TaxID=3417570 RepID=UPI003D325555